MTLKVLVACAKSDRVGAAFRKRGYEAWECDVLPSENPDSKWHIQDDVLKHLNDGWDLMIAHPPCTYLSNAGIGWFNESKYGAKAIERRRLRLEACEFVKSLYNAPIPHICIENPTGYLNSHWQHASQIIQPYYFGDAESKRTCLWLIDLPRLRYGANIQMFLGETAPPTSDKYRQAQNLRLLQ